MVWHDTIELLFHYFDIVLQDGHTALHRASHHGHEHVVKALIAGGANVQLTNNVCNIIHFYTSRFELLQLLCVCRKEILRITRLLTTITSM